MSSSSCACEAGSGRMDVTDASGRMDDRVFGTLCVNICGF